MENTLPANLERIIAHNFLDTGNRERHKDTFGLSRVRSRRGRYVYLRRQTLTPSISANGKTPAAAINVQSSIGNDAVLNRAEIIRTVSNAICPASKSRCFRKFVEPVVSVSAAHLFDGKPDLLIHMQFRRYHRRSPHNPQ